MVWEKSFRRLDENKRYYYSKVLTNVLNEMILNSSLIENKGYIYGLLYFIEMVQVIDLFKPAVAATCIQYYSNG